MNGVPPPFRKWDSLFLGTIIVIALGTMFLMTKQSKAPGSSREVVITDWKGKSTYYSLLKPPPEKLTVTGPLGETTIQITSDGARFISSPCPNHTCIRHGLIKKPYDSAACIPNRVIIRIESTLSQEARLKSQEAGLKKPELDGLTQ